MGEYICPHCHNPIYDDEALLCHFCGESLQRPGNGLLSRMRYSRHQIIVTVVVLTVLLSFLLLMIF